MAYCRFSCNCDVYCYEDLNGGFTTHYVKNDDTARSSVNDPDLKSFLERLIMLRQAGYRFPEAVIAKVRSEIERYGPDATETDD